MTTAIVTGASYGYALAWAIVFSILATIILQEMSARLGLGTRRSLGSVMRSVFTTPATRTIMAILVVAAIGIGGASYAGGDTSGTALAITSVIDVDLRIVVVILIAILFVLLWTGSYRLIEKVLMVMVGALAVIFIVTAIVVRPDPGELLAGMFIPSIPTGALLTTIALIGTTVMPYNLFLHASLVQENWRDVPVDRAMKESRIDTAVSISIGGIITLAVMMTAVGSMFVRGIAAEEGPDLAEALRPLLGMQRLGSSPWVYLLPVSLQPWPVRWARLMRSLACWGWITTCGQNRRASCGYPRCPWERSLPSRDSTPSRLSSSRKPPTASCCRLWQFC